MQQSETQASSPITPEATHPGLWRSPALTIARLTLESYWRSGWIWVECVLVLGFFAAIFFPYQESTAFFNGIATFGLGAIAIIGPAIMVRQATGARTYLLLARLTSRASYCRGLMLAAGFLRVPIYLFFLLLVLLTARLSDASAIPLLWGALGIVCNTIVVAVLTVGLSAPMATRFQRICFLAWLALMLFSVKPVFTLPPTVQTILNISQLPMWPFVETYNLSFTGTFDLTHLAALGVLVAYCVLIEWIASAWLEKRALLLH
jgi:hypothetical protein